MQKKQCIIFLFYLLNLVYVATGQYTEQDYVLYTHKNGLSDNNILSIAQDNKGYLWLGTEDGLNRFDGHYFKHFHQQGLDIQLLSGNISNLKTFSKNRLAILTRGGLQVLNTNDYTIQNYLLKDSTAFSHYLNAAWDAAEMKDGIIAVSTAAGFYVFKENGELIFRKEGYSKKDVGTKRILYARNIRILDSNQLLIDLQFDRYARYDKKMNSFQELDNQSQKIIITHRNGRPLIVRQSFNKKYDIYLFSRTDSIFLLNRQTNQLTPSPLPVKANQMFAWSSRIIPVTDSSFLITDFNGGCYLSTIHTKTGFIVFNNKKLLSGYTINFFYKDKEQRLWIGTKQGLLAQKLKKPFVETFEISGNDTKPPVSGSSCFYRYRNKIYTGLYSHTHSLAIIDTTDTGTQRMMSFINTDSNANEVRSIQMYHKDTLWIGTSAGVVWFDTQTERFGKVFGKHFYPEAEGISGQLFPQDPKGYAWICDFLGGKVIRYHVQTRSATIFTTSSQPSLPFALVKNIIPDAYGNTWITGHGITRWNTNLQKFDTFFNVYTGPAKYNDNIVVSAADNAGNLWLYNPYNGLIQYDINKKSFSRYGVSNGLPSDAFYCFSPVVNGKLWIGGNHALIQFDTYTKNSIVFDYNDGLPDAIPSTRYIYYDEETGYFYTGYNNKIARFKKQLRDSYEQSPVMISELVVNGKRFIFHPKDNIILNHNENNLTIAFTIIDFEHNNYSFYYSLDKASNWISLSNRRQLDLVNLKTGVHQLRLKTINKAGVESVLQLTIIISPVFWETNWFRLSAILLLASLIYLLYRYRIRQIRQKSELDKQLLQTEMKALHTQMNPHFIFNCLNSIREMILHNENKEASHYLSRFAQLIRLTLEQSSKNFISLRDTVSYLKLYTEMEQIRNSHFNCSFSFENISNEDNIMLPPMLIQPFIENSIWHGPGTTKKEVAIDVRFVQKNELLECIITDNGVGINQSKKEKLEDRFSTHHSFGIVNIENRIKLLNEKYQLGCELVIKDRNDTQKEEGTVVTIRLPIHINIL